MEPIPDVRPPGAVVTATESKSAASWSAIIAGAFVAAAVSVVLFALGSGLGFALISPWNDRGIAITTFAATTAIWLIVIQWLSSAAGGYIAGRLRTRWIGTHPHEVFFRDTAHGFVTWALATVLVAAVLCFSLTSVIGAGLHAASSAGMGAAQRLAGAAMPSYAYGLDRLLRTDMASAAVHGSADPRTEVTDVIAQAAVSNNPVSDADRSYLANLVAVNTGVTADDAQRRVSDFIATANEAKAQAKATVDAGRKLAAKTAIYGALALAIGAFIASVSAAIGGRLRDEHP